VQAAFQAKGFAMTSYFATDLPGSEACFEMGIRDVNSMYCAKIALPPQDDVTIAPKIFSIGEIFP
jgi:hypothetical protein